jgi:FKBP-type peptidyl-prolyl cis-trans isomerase (trigger factor)
MDLAAYLKTREMDEDKFISEEARPAAVKRVERSLLMDEIAQREKLELDKALLNESFQQTWGELQSDEAFKKNMRGKSQPSKQLMNAVARESASRAYVRQTLERMKAIATGQAPELSEDKKTEKPVAKKSTTAKKVGSGTKKTVSSTTVSPKKTGVNLATAKKKPVAKKPVEK